MARRKKTDQEDLQIQLGDLVDLKRFKLSKREVSVDGKKLPLAIGDRLLVNSEDLLVKTVASIQVYEDGRISYLLEWFDASDSSFKSEWVTETELAFLNQAIKEHKIVGI